MYGVLRSMKLWKKVLVGLVLGIILGVALKDDVVYIKPFGDLFIRLIKMIIVPLIFFAIVSGITSFGYLSADNLICYNYWFNRWNYF